MNDERKVLCKCRREMVLNSHARNSGTCVAAYACACGWRSPIAVEVNDMELAIERAYIAATATPPNLPLTREQVEAMPTMAAVWIVYDNNGCLVELRDTALRQMGLPPNRLYFSEPPTDADVAAARAGKGAEE